MRRPARPRPRPSRPLAEKRRKKRESGKSERRTATRGSRRADALRREGEGLQGHHPQAHRLPRQLQVRHPRRHRHHHRCHGVQRARAEGPGYRHDHARRRRDGQGAGNGRDRLPPHQPHPVARARSLPGQRGVPGTAELGHGGDHPASVLSDAQRHLPQDRPSAPRVLRDAPDR